MITAEEYSASNTEVEQRKLHIKPVKGTMSLYAVTTEPGGKLYIRKTICACTNCFGSDGFNTQSSCKWEQVHVQRVEVGNSLSTPTTESEPVDVEKTLTPTEVHVEEDDFIVTEYDNNCYIGQVTEYDNNCYIGQVTENDNNCYIGQVIELDKTVTQNMSTLWLKAGRV